jgi:hypothetical protein
MSDLLISNTYTIDISGEDGIYASAIVNIANVIFQQNSPADVYPATYTVRGRGVISSSMLPYLPKARAITAHASCAHPFTYILPHNVSISAYMGVNITQSLRYSFMDYGK